MPALHPACVSIQLLACSRQLPPHLVQSARAAGAGLVGSRRQLRRGRRGALGAAAFGLAESAKAKAGGASGLPCLLLMRLLLVARWLQRGRAGREARAPRRGGGWSAAAAAASAGGAPRCRTLHLSWLAAGSAPPHTQLHYSCAPMRGRRRPGSAGQALHAVAAARAAAAAMQIKPVWHAEGGSGAGAAVGMRGLNYLMQLATAGVASLRWPTCHLRRSESARRAQAAPDRSSGLPAVLGKADKVPNTLHHAVPVGQRRRIALRRCATPPPPTIG